MRPRPNRLSRRPILRGRCSKRGFVSLCCVLYVCVHRTLHKERRYEYEGCFFFLIETNARQRRHLVAPLVDHDRHLAPLLVALALLALVDQALVDVRDDTTTGDGGLDEGVKLLVTADGELEVARRDALHLQVLGCVTGELKDLGGEVLEDSGGVHSRSTTNALRGARAGLQVPVNTPDRELEAGADRPRHRLGLGGALAALATLATLAALASSRLRRKRKVGQRKGR